MLANFQVAFKSQKLDHMMVVEKKTASTMDPTHPPKNQPNFNKILPFFNLFSNSRTLTYYTWVDLMWISLVKQYIQNFLY